MGRTLKNRVSISRECALYLMKCEQAVWRIAHGQQQNNPRFDMVKHSIFHEELAYEIDNTHA